MNGVYQPDAALDLSVDDEFQYNPPRTQISDLHPGGPFYPEQSPPPPKYAQMSGAVNSSSPDQSATDRYATA